MAISIMMATIRTRLECSNSGGIYRKLAGFFSLLDNFSRVISPFFRPLRKDWLTVEEYPDHRLQSSNHYIIKVFFPVCWPQVLNEGTFVFVGFRKADFKNLTNSTQCLKLEKLIVLNHGTKSL